MPRAQNIIMRNLPGLRKKAPGADGPLVDTSARWRNGDRLSELLSRLPQPVLRFTDVISGPATGLDDGLGSGVIVTVWGQGFGESPGQVYFTDSAGIKRPAAHTYYWKRADGLEPGGPAQLWRSHLMYEVAFSIPAGSADGEGQISIERADGQASDSLPFTVRPGRILWVAPEGDNSNPGTFAQPKAYLNAGTVGSDGLANNLLAGDTVYSRGVIEPLIGNRGLYIRSAPGTLQEQIALIGYPGSFSEVRGTSWGIHPYTSTGIVNSKYKVSIGSAPLPDAELPENVWNIHIKASEFGRVVGCYLYDADGFCMNGQSGAISSGRREMSYFTMLGNHIFDVGCDNTSHFQHTTYFSIRSGQAEPVVAPEICFNFLEDCKAKFGIHVYDQPDQFGEQTDLIGLLRINNNVIVNQKGAGVNLQTSGVAWTCDAEVCQNVLVNCGLGPVKELVNGTDAKAIRMLGEWEPDNVWLQDNLILGYSDESSREYDQPAAIQIGLRVKDPHITATGNIVLSQGGYEIVRGLASFQGVNVATINQGADNFYAALVPHTQEWPSGWGGSVVSQITPVSLGYIYAPSAGGVPARTTSEPFFMLDIYGRPRVSDVAGPSEEFA